MSYEIKEYHGKYNIQPRSASSIKYIVVHYTGSGTPNPPAALNNCQYFSGGDRQASAHYFIDNENIYEYADPSEYLTWHVGDGKGKYGITNTNSIGIEVCQNGDNPFTSQEIERLSWLVKHLMNKYDVSAENVVRHYDASRKACPYYYTPSGTGGDDAWKQLKVELVSEKTGWIKSSNGKWWYRYPDGTYPKSEWKQLGKYWYYFDSKGWMLTGWQKIKNVWYYLDENGRMKTGWLKYKDGWYYLSKSGAMVSNGCYEINDKWYAFNSSGKMLEGSISLTDSGAMILN